MPYVPPYNPETPRILPRRGKRRGKPSSDWPAAMFEFSPDDYIQRGPAGTGSSYEIVRDMARPRSQFESVSSGPDSFGQQSPFGTLTPRDDGGIVRAGGMYDQDGRILDGTLPDYGGDRSPINEADLVLPDRGQARSVSVPSQQQTQLGGGSRKSGTPNVFESLQDEIGRAQAERAVDYMQTQAAWDSNRDDYGRQRPTAPPVQSAPAPPSMPQQRSGPEVMDQYNRDPIGNWIFNGGLMDEVGQVEGRVYEPRTEYPFPGIGGAWVMDWAAGYPKYKRKQDVRPNSGVVPPGVRAESGSNDAPIPAQAAQPQQAPQPSRPANPQAQAASPYGPSAPSGTGGRIPIDMVDSNVLALGNPGGDVNVPQYTAELQRREQPNRPFRSKQEEYLWRKRQQQGSQAGSTQNQNRGLEARAEANGRTPQQQWATEEIAAENAAIELERQRRWVEDGNSIRDYVSPDGVTYDDIIAQDPQEQARQRSYDQMIANRAGGGGLGPEGQENLTTQISGIDADGNPVYGGVSTADARAAGQAALQQQRDSEARMTSNATGRFRPVDNSDWRRRVDATLEAAGIDPATQNVIPRTDGTVMITDSSGRGRYVTVAPNAGNPVDNRMPKDWKPTSAESQARLDSQNRRWQRAMERQGLVDESGNRVENYDEIMAARRARSGAGRKTEWQRRKERRGGVDYVPNRRGPMMPSGGLAEQQPGGIPGNRTFQGDTYGERSQSAAQGFIAGADSNGWSDEWIQGQIDNSSQAALEDLRYGLETELSQASGNEARRIQSLISAIDKKIGLDEPAPSGAGRSKSQWKPQEERPSTGTRNSRGGASRVAGRS